MATLEERVAAIESKLGMRSEPAPAPVVPPPTAAPSTVDRQGYRIWPDDPLRAFMGSESTVARAVAKHKFDITIGNRVVTPLDADYGAAYNMSGRFAGVSRDLQAAWLLAILRDGGVGNPPPPWYLSEFGSPS